MISSGSTIKVSCPFAFDTLPDHNQQSHAVKAAKPIFGNAHQHMKCGCFVLGQRLPGEVEASMHRIGLCSERTELPATHMFRAKALCSWADTSCQGHLASESLGTTTQRERARERHVYTHVCTREAPTCPYTERLKRNHADKKCPAHLGASMLSSP